MTAKATPSRTRRVVALSAPAAGAPEVPPTAEVVRVASGYEAAAELLAAPTSALVADLARITPAHVGLLELARRMEVPVVAFGAVSTAIPAEALAKVSLVGPGQVGQTLAGLLAEPAPPAQGAAEPVGSRAGTEEPGRPSPEKARPKRSGPRPGKPVPAKPAGALSDEELRALLGGAP